MLLAMIQIFSDPEDIANLENVQIAIAAKNPVSMLRKSVGRVRETDVAKHDSNCLHVVGTVEFGHCSQHRN